jgi:hypothetical protein
LVWLPIPQPGSRYSLQTPGRRETDAFLVGVLQPRSTRHVVGRAAAPLMLLRSPAWML